MTLVLISAAVCSSVVAPTSFPGRLPHPMHPSPRENSPRRHSSRARLSSCTATNCSPSSSRPCEPRLVCPRRGARAARTRTSYFLSISTSRFPRHASDPNLLSRQARSPSLTSRPPSLPQDPNATGWEAFALDYAVGPPVCEVLTAEAMFEYRKIFTFLWKLKRAVPFVRLTPPHAPPRHA